MIEAFSGGVHRRDGAVAGLIRLPGRAALRMLGAQRAGDEAPAKTGRGRTETYMAEAKSFTSTGMRGTVTAGTGVIDTFATDASAGRTR